LIERGVRLFPHSDVGFNRENVLASSAKICFRALQCLTVAGRDGYFGAPVGKFSGQNQSKTTRSACDKHGFSMKVVPAGLPGTRRNQAAGKAYAPK
jgi:hypothetical protein